LCESRTYLPNPTSSEPSGPAAPFSDAPLADAPAASDTHISLQNHATSQPSEHVAAEPAPAPATYDIPPTCNIPSTSTPNPSVSNSSSMHPLNGFSHLHSRYKTVDQCSDPAHIKAKLEALKDRLGDNTAPRLVPLEADDSIEAPKRETSAAPDAADARFKAVLKASHIQRLLLLLCMSLVLNLLHFFSLQTEPFATLVLTQPRTPSQKGANITGFSLSNYCNPTPL
jgi:hypothetical protein